ncbi:hypothetical protein [Halovivax gelatinilyticus]|uniref:hypothetical protein n=1 Tax=Halovivax gelatinilyticus TaxID=2961597 RepID=UPI0020CA9998|nr:hypothetical protein [Halovivax gelatinilyticus]
MRSHIDAASKHASTLAIDSYADRMQSIMGMADHIADCSPFQKWLAKNGAEIEFDEHGEPERMRIDGILSMLKSDSFETAQEIASEALYKWTRSGNDPLPLRRTLMTWQTSSGDTETGYVGAVADR